MKNKLISILLVLMLCLSFVGCSEAERVSHNISKQADNFNVLRQLTVINNVTGDTIFTMTGKFSINVDESENQLEVTVENDDDSYSKHFVGLNDVTTYTVVDIDNNYVDKYKFTINYNPNMWIPVGFENID